VTDTSAAVRSYFLAERDLGIFLSIAGVVALAIVATLYGSHTNGFQWGVAFPLTIVGLAASFGGGSLAARSRRQAASFAELAASDPAQLAAEELPRMARVNANWPRVKALWGVTIVLSLATLLGVRNEGARGTALVFLATASVLMVIDTLAERRALVYTAHLRALER
jgi:hypothetical protein